MAHENRKKVNKFNVLSAGCCMFYKRKQKFSCIFFFIKTLDPDPYSLEMLDQDPNSMNPESGSTILSIKIFHRFFSYSLFLFPGGTFKLREKPSPLQKEYPAHKMLIIHFLI
jgi:hypothetical protein